MLVFVVRCLCCARVRARVCVIHWHCSAQLSMFNMEKRYRNKIIIIIIITTIITILNKLHHHHHHHNITVCQDPSPEYREAVGRALDMPTSRVVPFFGGFLRELKAIVTGVPSVVVLPAAEDSHHTQEVCLR